MLEFLSNNKPSSLLDEITALSFPITPSKRTRFPSIQCEEQKSRELVKVYKTTVSESEYEIIRASVRFLIDQNTMGHQAPNGSSERKGPGTYPSTLSAALKNIACIEHSEIKKHLESIANAYVSDLLKRFLEYTTNKIAYPILDLSLFDDTNENYRIFSPLETLGIESINILITFIRNVMLGLHNYEDLRDRLQSYKNDIDDLTALALPENFSDLESTIKTLREKLQEIIKKYQKKPEELLVFVVKKYLNQYPAKLLDNILTDHAKEIAKENNQTDKDIILHLMQHASDDYKTVKSILQILTQDHIRQNQSEKIKILIEQIQNNAVKQQLESLLELYRKNLFRIYVNSIDDSCSSIPTGDALIKNDGDYRLSQNIFMRLTQPEQLKNNFKESITLINTIKDTELKNKFFILQDVLTKKILEIFIGIIAFICPNVLNPINYITQLHTEIFNDQRFVALDKHVECKTIKKIINRLKNPCANYIELCQRKSKKIEDSNLKQIKNLINSLIDFILDILYVSIARFDANNIAEFTVASLITANQPREYIIHTSFYQTTVEILTQLREKKDEKYYERCMQLAESFKTEHPKYYSYLSVTILKCSQEPSPVVPVPIEISHLSNLVEISPEVSPRKNKCEVITETLNKMLLELNDPSPYCKTLSIFGYEKSLSQSAKGVTQLKFTLERILQNQTLENYNLGITCLLEIIHIRQSKQYGWFSPKKRNPNVLQLYSRWKLSLEALASEISSPPQDHPIDNPSRQVKMPLLG